MEDLGRGLNTRCELPSVRPLVRHGMVCVDSPLCGVGVVGSSLYVYSRVVGGVGAPL